MILTATSKYTGIAKIPSQADKAVNTAIKTDFTLSINMSSQYIKIALLGYAVSSYFDMCMAGDRLRGQALNVNQPAPTLGIEPWFRRPNHVAPGNRYRRLVFALCQHSVTLPGHHIFAGGVECQARHGRGRKRGSRYRLLVRNADVLADAPSDRLRGLCGIKQGHINRAVDKSNLGQHSGHVGLPDHRQIVASVRALLGFYAAIDVPQAHELRLNALCQRLAFAARDTAPGFRAAPTACVEMDRYKIISAPFVCQRAARVERYVHIRCAGLCYGKSAAGQFHAEQGGELQGQVFFCVAEGDGPRLCSTVTGVNPDFRHLCNPPL
nr:MAG TPA: hypothetical protein [Caudoviricetes sp.]